MTEKEVAVQKALGTFDHLKCKGCGKISYKKKIEHSTTTCGINFYSYAGWQGRVLATAGSREKTVQYKCECGSEDFE